MNEYLYFKDIRVLLYYDSFIDIHIFILKRNNVYPVWNFI